MAENLADNAPGTALFPQFESQMYRMVAAEVSGLTDQQLDWESDRWEWSKWSIRHQVSHMPSFVFSWLLRQWADQLFPGGTDKLGELGEYAPSPEGQWLDESKFRELPSLLGELDRSMRLAQYVLSRETVASLREKELALPDAWHGWPQLVQAHSVGMRWDPTVPNFAYTTLEATFRHLYWETTTHMYNIQRLKKAQGLSAAQEIPYDGYWALPDWDRSEP